VKLNPGFKLVEKKNIAYKSHGRDRVPVHAPNGEEHLCVFCNYLFAYDETMVTVKETPT